MFNMLNHMSLVDAWNSWDRHVDYCIKCLKDFNRSNDTQIVKLKKKINAHVIVLQLNFKKSDFKKIGKLAVRVKKRRKKIPLSSVVINNGLHLEK